MAALRERAPLFLRVNRRRGDLAAAQAALGVDGIEAVPHPLAPMALEVRSNPRRVRNARAYTDGLVEIQDAASQAVVEALAPSATGKRVLDYCAGGGGKSLALWDLGAAHVAAHDAEPRRMSDLPARAARAGAKIERLDGRALAGSGPWDLILADAPCSGSGAWRRQPYAKWRLTPVRLAALERTQADILDRVAALAPARIAYATCSILPQENAAQAAAFLERQPGWRLARSRPYLPTEGGDGFFLAEFERRDS